MNICNSCAIKIQTFLINLLIEKTEQDLSKHKTAALAIETWTFIRIIQRIDKEIAPK